MTFDERIAVLTEHHRAVSECSTFEAFKLQQLAFLEFLIEDFKSDQRKELEDKESKS